jgi:hypothetical protein
MLIVTSPSALLNNGKVDLSVVQVLIEASRSEHVVGVVSNRPKPDWFDSLFEKSEIKFVQEVARRNGAILRRSAENLNLASHDVLVLAGSQHDIAMGKNGKAIIVAAGWSSDGQVSRWGIQVDSSDSFKEILRLITAWDGKWWFTGQCTNYAVHALSDLSTMGKAFDQQHFRGKLKDTIKIGGPRLNALLAITARSMLAEGLGSLDRLFWGVYPSSKSSNTDSEVLSEFVKRLRTTVSGVHMAREGEPLFIRHKPSTKRSISKGIDRTDPSEQIETIHLNPKYLANLIGRNVVIIDDCTTHGVSFGVAAALLKKAGAKSVTCIALGKFGRTLRDFQIDIHANPFKPLTFSGDAVMHDNPFFGGKENNSAQEALRELLG